MTYFYEYRIYIYIILLKTILFLLLEKNINDLLRALENKAEQAIDWFNINHMIAS